MADKSIWKGGVSQIINIFVYFFCGISIVFLIICALAVILSDTENSKAMIFIFPLIVPISIAAWKYYEVSCKKYELTEERFKENSGVFNLRQDELELYRVKDITLMQPIFLRLFKHASIELHTEDITTPLVLIEAIPIDEAKWLQRRIRERIEAMREKKAIVIAT
ncbi:MAG: PH domain-containing protein [Methylococcaceae bacterium]